MIGDRPIGSSYYRMVRSLTGDLQKQMLDFFNWLYEKKDMEIIYKMLLGCDDPTPINELIKVYYDNDIDPSTSPFFKMVTGLYVPPSVKENLSLRDTELGQKALIVGNIKDEDEPYEALERE